MMMLNQWMNGLDFEEPIDPGAPYRGFFKAIFF